MLARRAVGSHASSKIWKRNFSSLFEHLEEAPPDAILNTALLYRADTNPKKVNLGIGAYRTNDGIPWVLPTVTAAEAEITLETKEGKLFKEYQGVDGEAALKKVTQEVLFGADASAIAEGRIASAQALSGTGACRVAGEFMVQYMNAKKMVYSNPTWGNHPAIFKKAGFTTVEPYPYWDGEKRDVDSEGMLSYLSSCQKGDVVLLHPVAHNPTGMDPSMDDWKKILEICQDKGLVPLLDNAYQGYASGSLKKDGEVQRMFLDSGMEFFVCQSFAKNLGLYGERIGMVHVVCKDAERAKVVLSNLKLVIRPMYSSPPLHGAQLVNKIFNDPAKFKQWEGELELMAGRIDKVRTALRDSLVAKGTPGNWDHITKQIGMFSYTGLTPAQVECLINDYSIYLLKNGRISLAGLNDNNVEYVAEAMDYAVRNIK